MTDYQNIQNYFDNINRQIDEVDYIHSENILKSKSIIHLKKKSMPKEVIIISKEKETGADSTEAWGSLTKLCENHSEFKYRTINVLKFPFVHEGYKFKKVKYNHKIKLKDENIK